jgi:hypothetical protein
VRGSVLADVEGEREIANAQLPGRRQREQGPATDRVLDESEQRGQPASVIATANALDSEVVENAGMFE